MAAGIQIWNASGQLIFDSNDKVLKEIGDFTVTSSASFDAAAWAAAANHVLASSRDDMSPTLSSPSFTYNGKTVSVSKANNNQNMNARIKVMLF